MSDIDNLAFYGNKLNYNNCIIRKKRNQSPRTHEINGIINKISEHFREKKTAPITDISYYRVGKMLGRGAFGKVNLAMHKLVRKLVALKSLNKSELTDKK